MIDIVYWACQFALGCFVLGMSCSVVRLLKGPSAADRVLALGIRFDSNLYFDIALLIALFGFVGSAAMAKFLLRAEVIEP